MRLLIPHKKSQIEVMKIVDKRSDELFAGVAGPSIQIVDQKKEWDGTTMRFAFTARMGFVSLPLNGTIEVGDHDVTVDCELPSLAKQFIGDGKIGASIEKKVQLLLQ
jgi:hypothetical protein